MEVVNGTNNPVKFGITGCDYTVEWGNGVTENFTDGVYTNYTYNFNTLNKPVEEDGKKYVVFKAYPQSGNITGIQFSHNSVSQQYTLKELKINVPYATSIKIYTNYRNNIKSLVKFELYKHNITDMRYMFASCNNLTTIPQLDTSKVTDMNWMFNDCTSLTTIPHLDTSKATNMTYMFRGCTNLTTIPQLDTSKVTNTSYMVSNCTNLTTMPQLNTSAATNMEGMFQNCTNLTTIPQLNTSKATNMKAMFNGCIKLTTVPQLNTSKVTDMNAMFNGCTNLTTITSLNTSNISQVDYAPTFPSTLLEDLILVGHKYTLDIANKQLDADALNALFTNLATVVSGQTITITGNPGTDTCDVTIAENKGWTVVA